MQIQSVSQASPAQPRLARHNTEQHRQQHQRVGNEPQQASGSEHEAKDASQGIDAQDLSESHGHDDLEHLSSRTDSHEYVDESWSSDESDSLFVSEYPRTTGSDVSGEQRNEGQTPYASSGEDRQGEKAGAKKVKLSSTPSITPSITESLDTEPEAARAASTVGPAADLAPGTSPLLVPEMPAYQYPVLALPSWYSKINESSYEMKQLGKKRPAAVTALYSLKSCVESCLKEKTPERRGPLYDKLRDHVYKAEIVLLVNKFVLKKVKIFNTDTGLPAIFSSDANFPADLKADSYQLYSRWYDQVFELDMLRGIVPHKGKNRHNDRIDPKYRQEHPTTFKFYGQGDLVLGQWWPTQLCAVRDGAHGQAQGGISGEKEKGAYSIVLSSGGYSDVDNGTTITYSGTKSHNGVPTENTAHMFKSKELQNPIRVLRSHQLPKSNPYRPALGLRYDGLFKVKGAKLVDKKKLLYHFELERCPDQEPIRCLGNVGQRPTIYEVREWESLRKRMKW